MRLRRATLVAACTFTMPLCIPATLPAQYVTGPGRTDPLMAEVDRLIAAGLAVGVHVGQRPYSGREIQRMLRSARARASGDGGHAGLKGRALDAFHVLTPVFGDSAPPGGFTFGLQGAGIELAHLESPPRQVQPFNGLGYIEAQVNPLGADAGGRTLPDGASGFGWLGATAGLGSRLELAIQTRAGVHSSGADAWRPAVERLVAAGRVSNAVVAVGRDHVRWGQGMDASTLFSDDVPPLDMIRISSDAPFTFPWVFDHLGPARATFLVADLTGSGHFRGERLAAWKLSVLPWERLELGATVASQQGGGGAPPARFVERVADLLPFVDAVFLGDRDLQSSNKLAGADVRLRVPEWGGFAVYVDAMLDDFDLRRVASTIRDDGAWVAGVSLPRVAGSRAGVTLEHHHTGVRFYRHGDFRSGVTHGGELLGNPLGPDGDAIHARVVVDLGPLRALSLRGAVEHRRANQYVSSGGVTGDDGTLRFHLVERRPEERRARGTMSFTHWIGARQLHLLAEAGLERVDGFSHVAGSRRTNTLLRLAASRRF